jgi:hypothetical protein
MRITVWESNSSQEEVSLWVHLSEELHKWNAAATSNKYWEVSLSKYLLISFEEGLSKIRVEITRVKSISREFKVKIYLSPVGALIRIK